MPEDDWDKVFAVNLKAIFLLSKHVIPLMIANGGGSVVNMSSIQALATQAGVAAYAATKGAVLSLTRVMALDHGKENIRVTAICPGTIETPLAHANARHWNPENPAAVLAGSSGFQWRALAWADGVSIVPGLVARMFSLPWSSAIARDSSKHAPLVAASRRRRPPWSRAPKSTTC